ncbi:hypothetical protein [Breznakiella homolactica]|uniref:Uncharacterized protein n=1 Tax=Breznakiella homolactica TaxID=2798577 RepID=A0A7T7XRJ8_9SPIR|nr:hypothetical protein [Breznakiella homolactica]QQO11176.1 hypothetical protein JFL75_09765 [Breznakiella homolactica]
MPDFVFPFPGKELAHTELSYDSCYERIPEADRTEIVDLAWNRGSETANTVWAESSGETDFFAIADKNGLRYRREDRDYVLGGRRYFSEYLSGTNTVTLYTQSVSLWAEQNGISREAAENLIMSHEFFHFLECTKLGLTSKLYLVPMVTIGPLKIGRTGIRALSEIGAHAFSRTYYDLAGGKPGSDNKK